MVSQGTVAVLHHGQRIEAFDEKAHPPVDLAQPLLAVDILGILGLRSPSAAAAVTALVTRGRSSFQR